MTSRPKRDFKLPEKQFRQLTAGRITSVKHGWKFLTEDTSDYWIDLTMSNEEVVRIPSHLISEFSKIFYFGPRQTGLFELTVAGQGAFNTLKQIDEFDKVNEQERKEYERLKRKFET